MRKVRDVTKLRKELESGRNGDGKIYPDERVKWAAKHPGSELYKSLEWDDKKLGHQARVERVRQYIQIYMVNIKGDRETVVLRAEFNDGGGYRDLGQVMARQDLKTMLEGDVMQELGRLRHKYRDMTKFNLIWDAIDKTQDRFFKRSA